MGRIKLPDNFRATVFDEVFEFRASTDRQAWYMAYEHFDDELVDSLEEIDEHGNVVRSLLEKENTR